MRSSLDKEINRGGFLDEVRNKGQGSLRNGACLKIREKWRRDVSICVFTLSRKVSMSA